MIKFLLEKEFKQIGRNSFLPKMIILMPIVMLLVLPWAANQEIKDSKVVVVDNDKSSFSGRLIRKATSSGYFRLAAVASSNEEALRMVESGNADLILEIHPDFEKELMKEGNANVMISTNSVNGVKGGLTGSYMSSVIVDFANELREEYSAGENEGYFPLIRIEPQYRFNLHLDYKIFMIPALMAMLITLLTGFLPAFNIVGEKEKGTIEQINVTPVKKLTFIMAKLIPYWVIGFVVLTVCFLLAAWVYGVFPTGSIGAIYIFTGLYVLTISGMGLIVSNYSSTLQQAMFVMFFFMVVMFIMSGLFTPVGSMPEWARMITRFNPLTYFIEVMRMVYLKGSSLENLSGHMFILFGFALVFNIGAVLSYRKNN